MTTVSAPDAGAATRRRPGRPRDEEIDGQIVEATLALIDAEHDVTVSRIVARSGVSRAALYRRWPSLTDLIAVALDVGREVPPPVQMDGDLRESLLTSMFSGGSFSTSSYSEARFRHRIRLVMSDRTLQKTYWSSHVARRRAPIETALREGIERGILRDDLDVEACFDAIAGVAYYQMVVRGDPISDPATAARIGSAFDVVWRGMLA